ncbi:MAG: proprotein convertase P-domain-containing protein, partial [Pirellulales bacterium]|nr:proprotein convertase P-domain-containing protein [Pirellulales bacterium]
MRRFRLTGRVGSRIAQQIVDRFLARRSADCSTASCRKGRAGSLAAESLEPRWFLSASPLGSVDELLGSSGYEAPLGFDDDVLVDLDRERLGFDGPSSAYLGEGEEALGDATPTGASYMLYDHWGGSWSDAEKTPSNYEDDLMCWAATASNVLAWTGWGQVNGMTNTDEMFGYFQDHWTDRGGLMGYGWDWWFDGTNNSAGWSGWSQVDVAGGGFYPDEYFYNYYVSSSYDSTAMETIDDYLRDGYGVGLGVYTDTGGGHAITCWGFNYDTNGYTGIWVSDSDDSKGSDNPTDRLRYYEVEHSDGRWYLENFYGYYDTWYIGLVQGLAQNPNGAVPEPAVEPTNEIQGAVFNDTNANGVQDQDESGIAGQTVFLDANMNGFLDEVSTEIRSTDGPRGITDLTTITSTFDINGMAGQITDLDVTLDITHTYSSDLEVYLIGPDGTRVLLFDEVGAGATGLANTTLDDQAVLNINGASTLSSGTFRPEGALADFNGAAANGTWTLEITDRWSYDEGTLNAWSLNVTTVESSTTTAADGSYSFAELADGDYRVVAVVAEGWQQTLPAVGHYDLSLAEGEVADSVDFGLSQIVATDLGTVDYAHVDSLELGAGQYWYSFETTRDGYLTVAADVSLIDSASVTLYDENFSLLAISEIVDGWQRIDQLVESEGIFFVCVEVAGQATVTDVYAVNLLQQDGNTVTVHGTDGDDRFLFAAASWHQITINDVQYDFNSTEVTHVVFDGGQGADTTVLNGSTGNDTLVARPTMATLTGDNYSVSVEDTESIIVIGEGGTDAAVLHDSAGDDAFVATPTYAELHGSGFYNRAEGFRYVYALANAGGTDSASLYGSAGNDTLMGKPEYTYLYGANFHNCAEGFQYVNAYAAAGGTDRAYLRDSAGNDKFEATPTYAKLSGSGFNNRAEGFQYVYSQATSGGTDAAVLHDSAGNDTFEATPTYACLSGSGFYNRAEGFRYVYALANAGGTD